MGDEDGDTFFKNLKYIGIDIGLNEDKRLEKGVTGIARRKYKNIKVGI